MILFHGTLIEHLPAILKDGIEPGEGWGGAGTSGVFLSGTPYGALYWAKIAYQRAHEDKMEVDRFDRDHGKDMDSLIAILAVEVPESAYVNLWGDEEQYEDIGVELDPKDWRGSLRELGDVRFAGAIPPDWIVEVIQPTMIFATTATLPEPEAVGEYINDTEVEWGEDLDDAAFQLEAVPLTDLEKAETRPLLIEQVDMTMVGETRTKGPMVLDADMSVIDGMHRLADAIVADQSAVLAYVRVGAVD